MNMTIIHVMSHLYAIFTKQVDEYCINLDSLCRKNMLSHGLNVLHSLNDDILDDLDPYQRGASELIWAKMVYGENQETDRDRSTQPPSIAIIAANSYGPNPLFKDVDVDYSAVKTGFEDVFGNSLNNNNQGRRDQIDDMEESSSALEESFAVHSGFNSASLDRNFLKSPIGPMVVRVRPDGSPVPEDLNRTLPVDEDKEEFRMTRQRLPTLEQIASLFRTPRPSY
ncbi:rhythmically expressed gene 5 protein isoform X2 [Ctenocephalides felis]|uniref:rhythmically expressed gene 5 protein isoform X2 n=1 Tax=Ctenocephalides felis TaxID=7515 RepID=UPI000E6E1E2A|nr:rhythmically expressed gene 5 protein isoform X2 [Ctenocephalides felis]